MKLTRFKYKLSWGAKVYHCGPANHGKIKEYRYRKSFWGIIFYYLFILGIWAGIALSIILLYLALTLPNIDNITNQTRKPSITIVDRYNEKITTINDLYGETVNIESLPPHVWHAIIATEDKRFFNHFGVDIRGVLRALYNNIKKNRTAQGGSTITQQLAKNVFLSHERSLERKIQEVMITLWLENKFTKEQILSLYLNRISLVNGKYGISTAAETLFNKSIYDINITESAILAGMLKAPSRFNPIRNPEASLERAHLILRLMREQNYITQLQYDEAITYKYIKSDNRYNQTRYFVDYTLTELSSRLNDISEDIIIHTTLNNKLQKTNENITQTYLTNEGEKYNFSQTANIVIDTNGDILAMIGGENYSKSQFNRATQMKRQPGSIFKPFVYLAGLSKGIKPTDIFEDKITEIGDWAPKNSDDKYIGSITMEQALIKSINTVTVQIAKKIGLKNIITTARKLGLIDKISNDYSIILGTSETTLVDLTSAYATFANKGYGVIPHSINKITNSNGKILYERSGSGVGKLISDDQVNDMNSMLKKAIEGGTGFNANISGIKLSGKTGTSQDNRDAWFIGYNSKYIIGVWIGNDNNSPMTEKSYGGAIPAKIFKAIMTYITTSEN